MNIISRSIIALLPLLLYAIFNVYRFIKDTKQLYSIIVFCLTIVGIAIGVLHSIVLSSMSTSIQLVIITSLVYIFFVGMLYAKALDESPKNINHGKIWLNAMYSTFLFAGLFSLYLFLLKDLLNQPFEKILIPGEGEQPLVETAFTYLLLSSVPISANLIMMLYISSSSSFFANYGN